MTPAQLQNLLTYVGIWVAIALAGAVGVAIGSGAVPGFADGQILSSARAEIASAIALLVTGGGVWLAANRPRYGSETIASQVSDLKAQGVHRDEMIVLSEAEAATALAGDPVAMIATMSAEDLVRVRDATLARHEALVSQSSVRFP